MLYGGSETHSESQEGGNVIKHERQIPPHRCHKANPVTFIYTCGGEQSTKLGSELIELKLSSRLEILSGEDHLLKKNNFG